MGQANLVMSSISISTPNVKNGEQLNLTFKIKNIGNATAGKSHTKIYLSTSLSYTNATVLSDISCESLFANQETQDINYIFPVPYNIPSGSIYVLLKVDSRNEVAESNESNNFNAPTPITVSNAITTKQNLPYPIIFVHGLNSNNNTWDTLKSDLQNFYGW